LLDQLIQYQERVNQALTHHLRFFAKQQKNSLTIDTTNDTTNNLFPAIEYATLNQGKRLRPALIYAVAEALGIPLNKVDAAACAIELIHSYSLVHDDLPAMDNDDLRRGQPTCHIKYDEATAILVGDAQQTLAFQILAEDQNLAPSQTIEMIRLLSLASGPLGMIGGQVLDIQAEGKSISLQQLKAQINNDTRTTTCLNRVDALGHTNTDWYAALTELVFGVSQIKGNTCRIINCKTEWISGRS